MHAADATFYAVVKGQKFNQTNTALPVLASGTPYRFNAIVGFYVLNTITNATVQFLPSGPVSNLVVQLNTLEFQAKFATPSDLDTAYPNGNYQLVIDSVFDGIKTLTLPLNGGVYPVAAPHISDYANTQAINPGIPFTLTWDAFSGGTSNDFIQLTIENNSGTSLFETPPPGQVGALNGTATSTVIPAGRLAANTAFTAQVIFVKTTAIDTNSYPGVPGIAGYVKETDFSVSTTSSTPAQDVSAYSIYKQQNFVEDKTNGLSRDSTEAFRFLGYLVPKVFTNNTLNNATLQLPGGLNEPLVFSTSWLLKQSFSTESAMDAAFPSGVYTFTYDGVHDYFQSLPLTLPTNSFPGVPHVNNMPEAQAIDPAASFKLTWDPIPGFVTGTQLILTITDSKGTNVISPVNLALGATNYTIAAGKLQAGQSYKGTLLFQRQTNTVSGALPGAYGSVFFKSQTSFNLTAIGGSPQPQLTLIPPNGTGQFQVQLTGQTDQLYAIEASTNLQSGLWVPLATNPATGGQFVFPDDQSSNFPARYYRGRLVQ
ncbi:MAG TPA: hypothetical protein VFY06_15815 [Verrucomicrobiae bacterium]|nr:hypothetical protein [Verrucomicrobiae bacterium]